RHAALVEVLARVTGAHRNVAWLDGSGTVRALLGEDAREARLAVQSAALQQPRLADQTPLAAAACTQAGCAAAAASEASLVEGESKSVHLLASVRGGGLALGRHDRLAAAVAAREHSRQTGLGQLIQRGSHDGEATRNVVLLVARSRGPSMAGGSLAR